MQIHLIEPCQLLCASFVCFRHLIIIEFNFVVVVRALLEGLLYTEVLK